MSMLRALGTLNEPISESVETGSAGADQLAGEARLRQVSFDGWQHFLDHRLIEWGRDPRGLEDDDVIVPSIQIIQLACRTAITLRDLGWPPPLRIVPNGEGGIVFENRAGAWFQTLVVSCDGEVELVTFNNSNLVSRDRLEILANLR